MKNIFTLCFILILGLRSSAQVFWTENFGTGCNQGQMADGVLTSNGTWNVSQTGTNDPEANVWYISAKEAGTGTGNCSTHSCSSNNRSLHVSSNDGISTNDAGCNYNAGGLCPSFFCVTTNARAESPVINCSGKSTITLTFNYIENGDGSDDNGTCWYYDGSTWSLLVDMPKTTGCATGQWTSYSITLPVSANNNSNVKIGFNWTNNDDGYGTDPSIAVDDIQLSVASGALPPTAKISGPDSVGCTPVCIDFADESTNNPTSWLWTFNGGSTPSSTLQNPGYVCYENPGIYSVKLVVSNAAGKDSITLTNDVNAISSPPPPTITISNDTLFCSYDTSYTSYQWYKDTSEISGATNSYYIYSIGGNYNVSVGNRFGCQIAVGIVTGIENYFTYNSASIFPIPAKDELTITGNWQVSNGIITVLDVLGKKIAEENVKLGKQVIYNIKNIPKGIYLLQIANDKGRWVGKFVKE